MRETIKVATHTHSHQQKFLHCHWKLQVDYEEIYKTEYLFKDALDQNWKLKLCKIQNYAKCITMYICALHNFIIRKILQNFAHSIFLYCTTLQLVRSIGQVSWSGRSVGSIGRVRSVWLPFNWIEYKTDPGRTVQHEKRLISSFDESVCHDDQCKRC